MQQQSTVKQQFQMCVLKSQDEILASLGECDLPVWLWLKAYLVATNNQGLNGTQVKMYTEFMERLSQLSQDAYEEYSKCLAGNVKDPETDKDPVMRVNVVTNGGGSSSSSGEKSGLITRVSIPFSPPDGSEVCGPLPYMLAHHFKQVYSINRCAEVQIQAQAGNGGGGGGGYSDGDSIVAAVLGMQVSLSSSRIVEYQVDFMDVPVTPLDFPPALEPRVEAFSLSAVQPKFGHPIQTPGEGWTIYLEVAQVEKGAMFWCGWRIPFEGAKWTESGSDQGGGDQTVDAASLFSSHPGVAMSGLNAWVEAAGAGGTWKGRVVVFDSLVPAAQGDVYYGGEWAKLNAFFPSAPFYNGHTGYVPGVSPGILLRPRPNHG